MTDTEPGEGPPQRQPPASSVQSPAESDIRPGPEAPQCSSISSGLGWACGDRRRTGRRFGVYAIFSRDVTDDDDDDDDAVRAVSHEARAWTERQRKPAAVEFSLGLVFKGKSYAHGSEGTLSIYTPYSIMLI